MLQGQDDEHVAMWDAFASAWDEIVADLREGDLVSDREADNLRFTRLCYDQGLEASGVRPILMPAFFFAGQMQRVVDTGLVDTAQGLVLGEARRLLVWLGAHLGLLGTPAVTAMLGCSLLPEVQDAAHQQSRERMLRACVRLLGAVAEVGMTARTPADLRRRQSLHAEAVLALCEVLSCLEVECQAVRLVAGGSNTRRGPGSRRNKWGFGAAEVTAAESLLAVAQAMRSQLEVDPTPISACLRALHDQEDDLGHHGPISQGSGISGTSSNMSGLCDATMVQKAVSVLLKMLTLTPAAARPQSTEAQRLLTFFMSSLANKQLAKPVALDEMLSWTVLTPCYEEDVLYPLSMSHAASQTGCLDPSAPTAGGPGPHALAGARPTAAGMSDLLTESEDQVSLMAFLRSVFPDDWEHFKERLGSRLGVNLQAVSEEAFAPAGPLADLALELQLWASFRGQLLYDAWIDDLVSSKFSYVVSSQVYGRNRNARELRNRWLAEGVDVLLEVYDKLKVAFLDFAPFALGGPNGAVTPAGTACGGALAQYSVLIQGRRGPPAAWESAEFVCAQRVEELYRVRLPHNRSSMV
ncbi:1,3-beta-glucan synthase component FKS1 [Haematococcus lacustris]|uniref:1,3-beta-glucan synthase component FKS1 n=1 Tax=Haematococcus lacustris TaxID=44745 RepID=A0A699YKL6_HAELA|nr:1,3-beta-glucan synthase component FKS1 [Haematococcus lacustris]